MAASRPRATDAHLKNPWGVAALPGGPNWVTNNHDHTSTIYDGTGLVQALVVNIPAGANGLGAVTGIVASSSTTDFTVTNGTTTAAAPVHLRHRERHDLRVGAHGECHERDQCL